MGSIGVALLITLVRGPWEEGWVGWHGGWSIKKKSRESSDGKAEEKKSALMRMNTNERVPQVVADPAEVEKGVAPEHEHPDHHQHHHGHDNQEAVNATDAEKSLEMRAAEDDDDEEKASSAKSEDDSITPVPVLPQETQA